MSTSRKRISIIINPVSGTASKKAIPDLAASLLDSTKFEIKICLTQYAGHGFELAMEAVKDKVDYVIAVGGDGTVNEVARALINTDTALGIIPMGSGNGLGRDLNISLNARRALVIIAEENVITIDYGKANGHIFFCTCGVGFDAIVANCAKGQKKRGMLMYLKNVVETFFQQQPEEYEIICPEGTIKDKAFVVTCANASQYGYNAHIAPQADIQDGKMNVMILKPLSLMEVPQTSIQLFTRTLDDNKKMVELVTQRVTIKRKKVGLMHIDGDPMLTDKDIDVEIIPQGLRVLVPTKARKKRPFNPLQFIQTVFNPK